MIWWLETLTTLLEILQFRLELKGYMILSTLGKFCHMVSIISEESRYKMDQSDFEKLFYFLFSLYHNLGLWRIL